MATKYFCDACGEAISKHSRINTLELTCRAWSMKEISITMDLCDSCCNALINEIHEEPYDFIKTKILRGIKQ